MNPHLAARLIKFMWVLTVLYWIIYAFGNKQAKTRQTGRSRAVYIIVFIAAVYFLATERSLKFLLFPTSDTLRLIGVLACAGGIALAVWSRRVLGTNWSGFVMIKQDHELVQRGPYRWVRHPLYTGLIIALIGTVVALSPTASGFLQVLVCMGAFYLKSRAEERFLVQEFGDRYTEYKKRVRGALIPYAI